MAPAHERDHIDGMITAWSRREPGLDVEPLHVAGRILRLAAHLHRAIDRALSEHELSFGDFDVINTLRREDKPAGIYPTDLARAALITSGAMTARLTRLERVGLVTRQPDRNDRRAVRVHLTAAGHQRAAAALRAVLDIDRAFTDPLEPPDLQSLIAALRMMLLAAEQ